VHVGALAVWFGVLVMTGSSAAIIFPDMRTLDPTLGTYPAYTGDHATLAAGHIASRLFVIADFTGFAMLFLATCGLGVWMAKMARRRRGLAGVRGAIWLLLVGTMGYQIFFLSPAMSSELLSYWDAARQGLNDSAEVHRLAFAEMHPTASRVMGGLALLTLCGLVSGLWSLTTDGPAETGA
jgi:hypothetical protein